MNGSVVKCIACVSYCLQTPSEQIPLIDGQTLLCLFEVTCEPKVTNDSNFIQWCIKVSNSLSLHQNNSTEGVSQHDSCRPSHRARGSWFICYSNRHLNQAALGFLCPLADQWSVRDNEREWYAASIFSVVIIFTVTTQDGVIMA